MIMLARRAWARALRAGNQAELAGCAPGAGGCLARTGASDGVRVPLAPPCGAYVPHTPNVATVVASRRCAARGCRRPAAPRSAPDSQDRGGSGRRGGPGWPSRRRGLPASRAGQRPMRGNPTSDYAGGLTQMDGLYRRPAPERQAHLAGHQDTGSPGHHAGLPRKGETQKLAWCAERTVCRGPERILDHGVPSKGQ